MRRAIPQQCHLDGMCAEKKLCFPANRICERTPESEPIFALVDEQLNEPANPLHDRAMSSYDWEEVASTEGSRDLGMSG